MKKILLVLIASFLSAQIAFAQNAVVRDFSCQDAGSTNAYACNFPVSPGAYAVGQRYWLKATTTNTGPATVNFNSINTVTIKKPSGGSITTDLSANDILAGQWIALVWNGFNMQLVSPTANSGSTTGRSVYDPTTTFFVKDEFVSQLYGLKWIDIGGTTGYPAPVVNRYGLISYSTPSSSGSLASLSTPGGGSGMMLPAATFSTWWMVALEQQDSATTARFGLMDSPTSDPPTNGIYVEKLAADTSWFCVARSGGTQTRSSAISAVDTNFHTVKIRRIDASTVGCQIDSGTEQTVTTNIPIAGLLLSLQIKNSDGAVKGIDLDYVDLLITVSR